MSGATTLGTTDGTTTCEPASTTEAAATPNAVPLDLLLAYRAGGPMPGLLTGPAELRLTADLARHPRRLARRGRRLAAELGQVVLGRSERAPSTRDRRFSDEAWRTNPVLRRIVQGYLAGADTARAALSDADLDWRDRARLELALDNVVAALAPSNHPLANPTGWKAFIDTGGGSTLAGLRNLIGDLAAAPRVPAMVRPDAFEVGRDLAVTPGAVVLRTEAFELIQYTPQSPTVRTRPLVIVPPVINRYYIADLAPGRSLVEYLVQGGQQVFLVSWRNPDVRHRDWGFDSYGQAILDAVDAARAITGADAAIVQGFCSGGTLQSMLLGALARRGSLSERVAAFGLAVCVLDQAQAGVAGALLDERTAQAAAAVSRTRGYLDGRRLAEVFAWLRPDDLIWSYWVNNYLQGREPTPFDILFWNADTTRMTAGLHRDFLDLGLRNPLVRPGDARMLGAPVDLSAVAVDGYVVAGVGDHISPWQNCYRSAQLFGARTRFVLSTSGHIAAIVNPPTNRKASYQATDDLQAGADEWAQTSETTSGSWWPDFLAWLAARSGPERAAPTELGGVEFPPLAAAPGTYVLAR